MRSPADLSRMARTLRRELREPGSSGISGPTLWEAGQAGITALILATNLVGVAGVLAAVYLIVPLPAVASAEHVRVVNGVAAAIYVIVALPGGALVGIRCLAVVRRWLVEDRRAGAAERRMVLLAPVRLFLLQIALWFGAALVFGLLDSRYALKLGIYVAATVVITGMITAACAYLLTERVLRPAAVRALAGARSEELAVPGVATRAVLAWGLGSGLLLLAVMAIGIGALAGSAASARQLAVAMVALSGIALAVGSLAVSLAARATAAPINTVTRAMEAVERGQLDTRVKVYDGTQIGKLQQGFNDMVGGLVERDRIRDIFGTYVDVDVADRVLEEGVRPDGEELEVTVMFVDVRDFTAFAERTSPPAVLGALNELFERVVPVIHDHGGRVDKFVGDGLMAVFGAPRRLPDHATQAVQAALEIAQQTNGGRLSIGMGLNSGPVVAGNVGAAGRLEFGVIGDAVNVAARVEAATRQTGDPILVAERTKELACVAGVHMAERKGVTLKGKTDPVRVYAPTVEVKTPWDRREPR